MRVASSFNSSSCSADRRLFSISSRSRRCARCRSSSDSMVKGRALDNNRPYFLGSMFLAAIILPFSFVVFRMRQHKPYVYDLTPIINLRNQPVMIAMYVEHSAVTYLVRRGKHSADIG